MTKENVTAFFQKMQTDEALKKQFATIQSELQEQMMTQLAEKLVGLGASSGFDFTAGDLREAQKELIAQQNQNRELTDEEVNAVAGGSWEQVLSCATFGIGCQIISVEIYDQLHCYRNKN